MTIEPNFQNLPAQLLVLLLGWSFTIYLQRRANRRTETLKRKDKLVDQIDELFEWAEEKLSENEIDYIELEDIFAGKLSRIEKKLDQINTHIDKQLLTKELLAEMRSTNFNPTEQDSKSTIRKLRETCANLAEDIDDKCNTLLFRRNPLFLNRYKLALIALVIIVILYH